MWLALSDSAYRSNHTTCLRYEVDYLDGSCLSCHGSPFRIVAGEPKKRLFRIVNHFSMKLLTHPELRTFSCYP